MLENKEKETFKVPKALLCLFLFKFQIGLQKHIYNINHKPLHISCLFKIFAQDLTCIHVCPIGASELSYCIGGHHWIKKIPYPFCLIMALSSYCLWNAVGYLNI